MKITEIKPLTSLRFVAALWVFLHHYAGFPYGGHLRNPLGAVMAEGHLGVTLFFVLSGFLITLRYFANPESRDWKPGTYYARRIARIWPLYYFLLFAFVIIPSRMNLASGETVILLTLSQGYFLTYAFAGIPTAWSLTVEETFYLIAPTLLGLYWKLRSIRVFRDKHPLAVLAGFLVLLTILFGFLGYALQQLSVSTGIVHAAGFMGGSGIVGDSSIEYLTIFFRIFEFGIGIWGAFFYAMYLKSGWWQKPETHRIATGLCAVGIAGTLAAAYLLNHTGGPYDPVGRWLNYPAAIFMGIIVVSLTREGTFPFRLLSARPLLYLGRISYALYLVQMLSPITAPLRDFAASIGAEPANRLSYVLFMYITLSLVSAILYETVEKYGGKLVMWIYHRAPALRLVNRPL